MTYTPTKEHPHPSGMGGTQKIYEFPNGYGASVVRFPYSYGGPDGLWELGVIQFDADGKWTLTYDTPITTDVLGYLTESDVEETLGQIEALA